MIGKNNRYYPPIQNSPEATTTNNPLASGGTTIGVDKCEYFVPADWAYTDVSAINPVLAVLGPDNADYTYPETVRITGISAASGAGNLTVTRGIGATATIGAAREWPVGTKIAAVNTAQQLQQIQNELTYFKDLQTYQPIWDVGDTTTITGLTGSYKWIGACLAPNGKIYCVPYNSTTVLIIDPETDTADTTTITGLTGSGKWYGACLAPNGKIYCVPYNSTTVLIIDPETDTADTTTITGLSSNTYKWCGACLAPNGKIYCVPRDSTTVLINTPSFPKYPIAPMLSPYLNKF
jgi:hypothetical protein